MLFLFVCFLTVVVFIHSINQVKLIQQQQEQKEDIEALFNTRVKGNLKR